MPDDENDRLNDLLGKLFQPISNLLIENEIPIQQALELLKVGLVNSVCHDPSVTDSYVSLKTGLHRKDVRRLRADAASNVVKYPPINPVSLALSRWANDEMFQDDDGNPRDLTRSEFDDLIRTSKIDLPPATVMTEMLAQDLMEETAESSFQLKSLVYLPKSDTAALAAFEATIVDHLRIAVDNTLGKSGEPKSFDRVLRYSHLSPASLSKLEDHAKGAATAYLTELNELAFQLQQDDGKESDEYTERFVSGVFIAPSRNTKDKEQS